MSYSEAVERYVARRRRNTPPAVIAEQRENLRRVLEAYRKTIPQGQSPTECACGRLTL